MTSLEADSINIHEKKSDFTHHGYLPPTERSAGGISPFLKGFLDRLQWIVKVLGIKNWTLHCWMVLSTYGEMFR